MEVRGLCGQTQGRGGSGAGNGCPSPSHQAAGEAHRVVCRGLEIAQHSDQSHSLCWGRQRSSCQGGPPTPTPGRSSVSRGLCKSQQPQSCWLPSPSITALETEASTLPRSPCRLLALPYTTAPSWQLFLSSHLPSSHNSRNPDTDMVPGTKPCECELIRFLQCETKVPLGMLFLGGDDGGPVQ